MYITQRLIEKPGVSVRTVCEHQHRIPQLHLRSPGPLDVGTVFLACTLHSETRASRGQVWQLKIADFFLTAVALPTQVEWTNLLFFFPLRAPRRREFTHLRTRFPNLFSHHSAKSEMPDDLCYIESKGEWMRAWPLSLEGVQRPEPTRREFLFQILHYCALRNGTKLWILKPASAQTSPASKDHVLLSHHNQVPYISGKDDFMLTIQGSIEYRIDPGSTSFPRCPQSFLSVFFFSLKT